MYTTNYNELKRVLDLYSNISEISNMLAVATLQGNKEVADRYAKILLTMNREKNMIEKGRYGEEESKDIYSRRSESSS